MGASRASWQMLDSGFNQISGRINQDRLQAHAVRGPGRAIRRNLRARRVEPLMRPSTQSAAKTWPQDRRPYVIATSTCGRAALRSMSAAPKQMAILIGARRPGFPNAEPDAPSSLRFRPTYLSGPRPPASPAAPKRPPSPSLTLWQKTCWAIG